MRRAVVTELGDLHLECGLLPPPVQVDDDGQRGPARIGGRDLAHVGTFVTPGGEHLVRDDPGVTVWAAAQPAEDRAGTVEVLAGAAASGPSGTSETAAARAASRGQRQRPSCTHTSGTPSHRTSPRRPPGPYGSSAGRGGSGEGHRSSVCRSRPRRRCRNGRVDLMVRITVE